MGKPDGDRQAKSDNEILKEAQKVRMRPERGLRSVLVLKEPGIVRPVAVLEDDNLVRV
jgi:hypothetical protein